MGSEEEWEGSGNYLRIRTVADKKQTTLSNWCSVDPDVA